MNNYFNGATNIVPYTRARAEDVVAAFQAVADGFDKIPDIFPGVLTSSIVGNYASLKALPKAELVPFYPVTVLGALSRGDGGFGVFSWDPSSTATVDGGTIIAANEGGVGRWLRNIATKQCWLEWFGVDMTGGTQNHAQVIAWIKVALPNKMVCHVGPGTVLLGQPTVDFTMTNELVKIVGAGRLKTKFKKADGVVTGNGQSMFRFIGGQENGYAEVHLEGVTLDFNCDNNVTPGGNLTINFTWQHNECFEVKPNFTNSIQRFTAIDVGILNPISDGLSVRNGAVNELYFERVINPTWSLTEVRPRVRGDICITGIGQRTIIKDCRLPRLDYEIEYGIPDGFKFEIDEYNNQCGEVFAHFAGNGAKPDRIVRNVWGGSVWRGMFQGNAWTKYTGTSFNLIGINRMTGGRMTFRDCPIHLRSGFSGGGPGTFLFPSSPPTCDRFEFIGNVTITADPDVVVPEWLVQADIGYQNDGGVHLRDFTNTLPGMRAVQLNANWLFMRNTTWMYDGSGAAISPALVTFAGNTVGRNGRSTMVGNKLTNPAAKMVNGPVQLGAGATPVELDFRNNMAATGMLFDLSSTGGTAARIALAAPYGPVTSGAAWTFSRLDADEISETKPATGDFVRGQYIRKIGLAASTSPGWACILTGPAAPAKFVDLPALGT